MNIQDVKKAKVGNIVATLKKANRQHTMVVSEAADGSQTVCGLFPSRRLLVNSAHKCRILNWHALSPRLKPLYLADE